MSISEKNMELLTHIRHPPFITVWGTMKTIFSVEGVAEQDSLATR